MKKTIMTLVALALVAAVLVWQPWQQGGAKAKASKPSRAVPVTVVAAEQRPFSLKTQALGTLSSRESVAITANVSEKVASIHFEDGQRVERGDILVMLEQGEEQAQLSLANIELADQQRETKHLEKLRQSNSISQNVLDARRTQLEAARQRIREVQASIQDRTLKAPFSGVLGLRRVSPGALVSPGTLIVTLDDVTTMKLDFSVPAIYLSVLQEGMDIAVTARVFEGRRFSGQVTTIDSRIDPVSRSIQVRAQLPNPDGLLKPGMLMEVELVKEQQLSIVLPEVTVVSLQDRHFVLVVSENDGGKWVANRRDVKIGGREYGLVQVLAGLEAGEQVVLEGVNRVRTGSAVTIKQAANAESPGTGE
ncbi:efflux RND transporter periplasmic adaptor subunit [Porticoccus sp. W117]|uniref:efflux RND transporter periplasmic adaptor subunit n=1 Tax=Porticoccus sp. W117 TaxID=3054777 RepID=UPI0025929D46|nr:efflux RND transporter periplasmic adaptor subunit [Porticoccus sp. W117]MDM3870996.1 efflux RND transporter periplasmic adaptor subunit [Porticoccus sp. W117]